MRVKDFRVKDSHKADLDKAALHTELEHAAARWVQRRLAGRSEGRPGQIDHERRVLAIATTLFDLTHRRLHLSASHGRLLRLAALLHDVGRAVSERDHPSRGAEMIGASAALALSPAERRQLMFLTRYHRGAVPPAGREEYLTAADDRHTLDRVLALLRAADGLDNRQLPPLELTCSLSGHHLRIDADATGDIRAARRVFTRRKKFRMLEALLGHEVSVEVRRAAVTA